MPSKQLRCDDCGRFVAYADLESGSARHLPICLDNEFSPEEWETLCKVCNNEEQI
jgi:hypothetical protein